MLSPKPEQRSVTVFLAEETETTCTSVEYLPACWANAETDTSRVQSRKNAVFFIVESLLMVDGDHRETGDSTRAATLPMVATHLCK